MKLLIAIDGSHHSMAAVHAIARRAFPPGTQVRLLTVAKSHPEEIPCTFDEAVSILSGGINQFVIDTDVAQGNIRDCILHAASTFGADLVVMGCRGHSLLEDLVLGSVSQSVIENAQCPVIVAREVDPSAIGNILVTVDDSQCSAAAVEWLSTQPWADGQTIALVSVAHHQQPHAGIQDSVTKASEAIMEWETELGLLDLALSYWCDLLRQRLPSANIHYGVTSGDPREMLVKACNNWPADIVVMGSSGRKGLAKLILGSVSQNIAARAHGSVLIVRGHQSHHFQHVHALLENRRHESPMYNEPSHRQYGTQVSNSPIVFFW